MIGISYNAINNQKIRLINHYLAENNKKILINNCSLPQQPVEKLVGELPPCTFPHFNPATLPWLIAHNG
jgi:hypothetical protein